MGKKGSWFSAVKKALSSDSQEKRDKKVRKSKGWFGRKKSQEFDTLQIEPQTELKTEPTLEVPAVISPHEEEQKTLIEAEDEQNKQVYYVPLATAAAAEAAVAAAEVVRLTNVVCNSTKSNEEMAAAEVVRLANVVRNSTKSKEEMGAVKIQTAFRGYMARRAFRALKGLIRLKNMIEGQSVKRQATVTLKCMQTLARVQSEIHARRIRMSEENESFQRQLELKREKELEKMRASNGDNWNDGAGSKEQVEAKLQRRQEAANRREKALAYSNTHQQTWRNTPRPTQQQTFMDPNNPNWGWSWLERWMASRPWEPKAGSEKEPNTDLPPVKSTPSKAVSVAELQRAQSCRDSNKPSPMPSTPRQSRPPSRQSPSTPQSRTPASPMGAEKLRSPSTTRGRNYGTDEDSRSMCSPQPEYQRRHSIGSSMRDNDSLASSPASPSYPSPTKSTKTRSRPSPLGLEKNGTPERASFSSSSTKKKLSFSGSPASSRRHSGPPKVEKRRLS